MKKNLKNAMGLTKFGVATGLGAAVVSQAGGDASGVNAMASFAPVAGNVMGAGMAFGELKKLTKRR